MEAEEREKQGRPGNTYHVNDVRWIRCGCGRGGGGGGGGFPISGMGAINLRASFLLVKRSTHDVVNVCSLAWR